ncbi:MAG: hypothetical protein JWP01_3436 [Myxococcales bacterium]|nr:hypothetical protein [Myxococcales bacterium]
MPIASPEATGHGGPFFEQHVDAAFLALLLVRATPPFLLRTELVELHLQTAHLGFATDDLLLVGVAPDGVRERAALSVKRSFSVAKSDIECVDVFSKAWRDFRSTGFDRNRDRIGLITRPATERLQQALRVLLETARGSIDGADLLRRLSLPGYRDQRALNFATIIREVIQEAHSCTVADDDLRHFLRCFDFVCLDLNTPSSSTEALIRSLLQTCARTGSSPSAGANTWNALLGLVSHDTPTAASFRWEDLPSPLRDAYSASNPHLVRLLEPFAEMTRTVSDGVDVAITGYHVERVLLEQHALELLETKRVLLLGGLAGSGKSAIAKALFEKVSAGTFAIAMRAGMLARSHLGETLFTQQTSIGRLRELLALHPTKVLWIEAGERLLEKPASEREAFNDMLRLLRADPSWKVIITCRAYSIDTFRAAFLDQANIESALLIVPSLSDDELTGIANAHPHLSRPLASPVLRSLLSNLFFLRMAAQMNWVGPEDLPQTERAFRGRVWRQVIRRDDETADGMPHKRDATYMRVAIRRAQSLDAFVDARDLDPTAVERLKADTLLFENSEVREHFAPSHDVLEDWALLEWLDREFARVGNWRDFISAIGTHPAIRRTFRSWLSERVDTHREEAVALITDASLPRHWTDDAIVALFRGSDPAAFLTEQAGALLASNASLLQRALHLVRVACKEPPSGTAESTARLRPVGVAWERLAEFVANHLDEVVPYAGPLLLRFIEDWAVRVTIDEPYPAGSNAVSIIAQRLLDSEDLTRHSRQSDATRILKVLLQVPRMAETRIAALASDRLIRRFRPDDVFVELALSLFHGAALSRDFPDVVFSLVYRLLQVRAERPEEGRWRSADRETLAEAFGLSSNVEHFGNPASSLNGPFLNLLRGHPRRGLDMIIEIINRCSDSYLGARNVGFHGNQVLELEFELRDSTRVTHRGDGRLWPLYRINSGPEVLRSMLMALESWLLQIGALGDPTLLRDLLLQVMKAARSLALTAVVASTAMAFPRLAGELVIPLLAHPVIFDLDLNRFINDQSNFDKSFADSFPATSAENYLFKRERSEAAEQPHRQTNLENLAVQLQLTEHRDAVLRVLDDHRGRLPQESEQDDEDRMWRLRLHRIDTRTFERAGEGADGRELWRSGTPPPDVLAVVERDRPAMEATRRELSAYTWGFSAYERKSESLGIPNNWRVHLDEVRRIERVALPFSDASLIVAVVCLRDFFEDMNEDERGWCVDTVCAAFPEESGESDRLGLGPVSGTREAAIELGAFISKIENAYRKIALESALTHALLTEEHEVSRHAAASVGRHVWRNDRQLALSYATAILVHAQRRFEATSRRRSWPRDEAQQAMEGEAEMQAVAEARATVAARSADMTRLLAPDYRKSPARFVLRELIEIFGEHAGDNDAFAFFAAVGVQLRSSWAADANSRSRQEERETLDYETEYLLENALGYFSLGLDPTEALSLLAPYAECTQHHPDKVAKFVERLVLQEDRRFAVDTFWPLWRAFAGSFVDLLNTNRNVSATTVGEIAGSMFLDLAWKDTTTSWRSLTGREALLSEVFERIAPREETTERFAKLLTTIGGSLVPSILPVVATKVGATGARVTDATVRYLEQVLAKIVYAGESRIRREGPLRDATLRILDTLVDSGSSTGYRLRDDFVTPLRIEGPG